MGIFSNNNKKLTSKEVHKALYGISGINSDERDEIMDALEPDKDMGGITEFELERTLRKLASKGTIARGHIERIKKKLLN